MTLPGVQIDTGSAELANGPGAGPHRPARHLADLAALTPATRPPDFGGIHGVSSAAGPGLTAKPVLDIIADVATCQSAYGRYASRRWSTWRTMTSWLSSMIRYRTRYSPRLASHRPSNGGRNGAPTILGRSSSGPEMNSHAAKAAAGGRD